MILAGLSILGRVPRAPAPQTREKEWPDQLSTALAVLGKSEAGSEAPVSEFKVVAVDPSQPTRRATARAVGATGS